MFGVNLVRMWRVARILELNICKTRLLNGLWPILNRRGQQGLFWHKFIKIVGANFV